MSQAPSTFGTITTSSRSPMAATSSVRSSSIQGLSSALMRVQSCVSPSSISEPTLMRPSRAASLRSTGTASSRLPSRMSTWGATSGAFATIFSLEKSRKWIIRLGLTGISSRGSGAPMASGFKKSRGLRIAAEETTDLFYAEAMRKVLLAAAALMLPLALILVPLSAMVELPLEKEVKTALGADYGKSCDEYETVGKGDSDAWREEDPLPTLRDEPRGVKLGDTFYLAGGAEGKDAPQSVATFQGYSFDSGAIRSCPSCPRS